ncbi:peptidylprolyl isomerase [Phakopsora pachyrhizi]|uniref:Peptidyl-prolyl cis-trans isomerase n=1 Tax=Phakopsora pachyrhizi TaxID=170000 RepID=A0AAV0AW97_PHAPC|nr:peptidylprolyl isomerase [Phakopsora pachyrhizi]CAH7672210.1 peptidylprolyl isomerase [Phakopsora pachyrhizi]
MSVLFETSLGDLVVDLEVELCPKTSENFLKLCKIYYYNFCSFFNVQKDFIAQTGDPTDLGTGGESIYSKLKNAQRSEDSVTSGDVERYFEAELSTQKIHQKFLNHSNRGTLSMAVSEQKSASQFFFTLADNLSDLDHKHVVFGRVIEGIETLEKINEALVDGQGRPLRDIRLRHVIVLDDPFDDPPGLIVPPKSPSEPCHLPVDRVLRVGDDEELDEELDPETLEERRRERDARAQALTLEMVGDLPFAEVSPPENILFVCKLNSITRSEDLELIFSRFGTILSCEVIKDSRTGDSLQYAFIEFDQREDAERAYFKMDGVLIDDRRIHVDFSQSVSKLHSDWLSKRRGRQLGQQKRNGRQPQRKTTNNRDSSYEMAFDDTDLARQHRAGHGESHKSQKNREARRNDHVDRRSNDSRKTNRHRSRSPVSRRR